MGATGVGSAETLAFTCPEFPAGSSVIDNRCKALLDDVALRLRQEPPGTVEPRRPRAPAGPARRAAVAPPVAADAVFRCIDCHGGTSPLGRVRVKALAAKDAFWYIVGHFEEPDGMRWPLWDEDCLKCHTVFDETALEEIGRAHV